MEFRLLGPLEVLRDGYTITLGGSKQRALLALLLLHANEGVSRHTLIDELWGERPPGTAAQRLDAELMLGRHQSLVSDLESLASRHPLRERLRALLMLALYRSGRQAEALRVYADTRRRLVDELGIEPGQLLQELERSILRHD